MTIDEAGMRSLLIGFMSSLGLVGALGTPAQITATGAEGLSKGQFRALADSLPDTSANIRAVRLFGSPRKKGGSSAAVTTFDGRNGWQIFVFEPTSRNKFVLSWKSGILDDSFAVSDPSALRVFKLGSGDAVVFEGCAKHVCPDVFSILLYVPSAHAAFTARYVWGKISFSSSSNAAQETTYTEALEQLIRERRDE